MAAQHQLPQEPFDDHRVMANGFQNPSQGIDSSGQIRTHFGFHQA